jgi:excisionase family DNA binding protein
MPQAMKSKRTSKSTNGAMPVVMDLAAAAKFLKLPKRTVERLVAEQGLPGRKIGKQWRFLRAAIERWLEPGKTERGSILDQFGMFANDPTFEEYRKIVEENRRKWNEEVA